MISIIIPCYNGFKYMKQCLNHLENQTFNDFEIVICDDCSTDDSYLMLKEYFEFSKMRSVILKNDTNVGPGESRNRAIAASHGDYLMFCDCDDWYESNALQTMLDAMTVTGADLVMCDTFYVDSRGKKIKRNSTSNLVGCNDIKRQIALARMSLCRILVKKNLFDGVVIPSIYNGEDGAVVPILLSRSQKSIFIEEPLYNYYIRSDSGSTKVSPRVYEGLLSSFANVNKELKKTFPNECEFIGIKTVLYGAVFNAVKAKVCKKKIVTFIDAFTSEYCEWRKNKYFHFLSKTKRIFLHFVKNKNFIAIKFYTFIHVLFEKRMSAL